MRLSSLTSLGFEVNARWDTTPDLELTLEQVHDAARERSLAAMLASRFGGTMDLSILTNDARELREVEQALCDSASALEGRERRKVGVSSSGLCLVMAIIFEAIQQQFCGLNSNGGKG